MHRARLDLVTAAARTIFAFTVRCSSTIPAILVAATSPTRSPSVLASAVYRPAPIEWSIAFMHTYDRRYILACLSTKIIDK